MKASDKVGVVNNLLHSIFEQVQVYLNNTPVENSNKTYPYRAYLENLLCYNRESKETLLRSELWVKDTNDVNDYENYEYIPPLEEIRSSGTVIQAKRDEKKVNEIC